MITKLRLRNWRSHDNSEFTFSSGVNALLGIMGSGKTSVMDAISFALFGTFPMHNQRKVKLDELVRNKPEQQHRAEVELEFVGLDKEVYSVQRILEPGKTATAKLSRNGQMVDGPSTQRVTEHVEKILKVDYDTFSRAIYAEQNEMDQFLNIPKGKRMEQIDRLLKIDCFEIARKTAVSLVNRISAEAIAKGSASGQIISEEEMLQAGELERNVNSAKEQIAGLKDEACQAAEAKDARKEALEALERKAEELNSLKIRKEGLTGQISEIKAMLGEVGEKLSEFTPEKLESEKEEIEGKLSKLNSQETELNLHETKKASLESTIKAIDDDLAEINSFLLGQGASELTLEELNEGGVSVLPKTEEEEQLAEKISSIEAENGSLDDIKKKYSELSESLINSEKELAKLDEKKSYLSRVLDDLGEKDSCPVCKSDLGADRKQNVLDEQQAQVSAVEDQKAKVLASLGSNKATKERLGGIESELSGLHEQLKGMQSSKEADFKLLLSKVQKRDELAERKVGSAKLLEGVSSQLRGLKETSPRQEAERLKEELRKLESVEKAFESKEKLESLNNDLTETESKIAELAPEKEAISEAKAAYEAATLKEQGLKNRVESLQELISEREKRLEEFKRKKEQLEEYKRDIQWLNGTKNSLDTFQGALRKTQESLRKEFIEIVNEVMSEIWGTLYPYNDLNSVKLAIEDRDYVLKVKTSRDWVNVEGQISGGERSLACLALRIAFSLALAPNLSWLVLDEPTHNLDTEAIDELSITMRERLPSLIDQIFLITHEERLEAAVTGSLYRLDRNKEVDEPTQVNLVTEAS
jgi:exonuclease SbcC